MRSYFLHLIVYIIFDIHKFFKKFKLRGIVDTVKFIILNLGREINNGQRSVFVNY
jgi:hypothetical protein